MHSMYSCKLSVNEMVQEVQFKAMKGGSPKFLSSLQTLFDPNNHWNDKNKNGFLIKISDGENLTLF